MPESNEIQITGVVENVTFRNEENGFTVLDLNSDGDLITAVGVLPHIDAGENLRLLGKFDFHASFGRQFKIRLCERTMPKSTADLLKYLSSGAVKEIGPATATKIIDAFGENTFDVIENDPDRLATIKGISKAKAVRISRAFREQFAIREIMIRLEHYGMSPSECLHAFKAFGNKTVELIEDNPYLLCDERIGMGFERADAIANNLVLAPNSDFRIRAGIVYIVKHNLSNGHTCIPRAKVIESASMFLEISPEKASEQIDIVLHNKQLVEYEINGTDFLFIPHIYAAEKKICDRIKLLVQFPPAGHKTLAEDIRKIQEDHNISYEEKQLEAITTAIEKGILILTGGPGTGKTTTINGIIELFEGQGLKTALCAPTGRAAKRMSEVTGREAKTIHRLLEVEFDSEEKQTFARNIRNPLTVQAVIVDELSMVDVCLFAALLDALPLGCRLVMVGDSNQLPPVGSGNVLHDLINSHLLPTVELTEVFRQAMESLIVRNAHKIVKGESIDTNDKSGDFFFMPRPVATSAAQTSSDLLTSRLPKAYGYSPLEDIQILCPSRKGEAGTVNINRLIQMNINPPSPDKSEINTQGRIFREGDKVMQIKNNYDIVWTKEEECGTGIFNGDIGILEKIDLKAGLMRIVFDDKVTEYPTDSFSELELAYAITVHKSQGNEFDAVIMPLIGLPPQLAYRNLLYTAVTRAKKHMIIVGNLHELESMIANNKKSRRYSALKAMLEE
ncbi:MAG: ATP-dependent RecD-like DNA helicase [Clostridia bacterium]|nr:ATP-dependent RecD-like DNA helicase [Clostridia bacterium]